MDRTDIEISRDGASTVVTGASDLGREFMMEFFGDTDVIVAFDPIAVAREIETFGVKVSLKE